MSLLNNVKVELDYYSRSEKFIIFAISASIAMPMFDNLVNAIFMVKFWDSAVTKGTYYISILIALYYSYYRLKKEMIMIPILFLGLWVISYIFFPLNRSTLTDEIIVPLVTEGFPLFIITMAVRDYKRLYKALHIASIIAIFASLGFMILMLNGRYEISYMSFSYAMLLPVMLITLISLQNNNILDRIFAFSGAFIIFVTGCRGAIVCVLSGTFFYLLINIKLSAKYLIFLFSIIALILYLTLNYTSSINLINDLLQSRNISSRTILLMLNDNIDSDSGRKEILDQALTAVKYSVTGYGMGGDRVILGTYTHNIFTEVVLEYGVILGFLFLLILSYNLLKALFRKNQDELYYFFFAILFSAGFMKLQFSSSYAIESAFFIMLALLLKLNKTRANFQQRKIIN